MSLSEWNATRTSSGSPEEKNQKKKRKKTKKKKKKEKTNKQNRQGMIAGLVITICLCLVMEDIIIIFELILKNIYKIL